MEFGEYFRALRTKKKFTQKEIADAIGKSPMLVSGVELGKNSAFNEADIAIIANIMGLSESERNDLVRNACISRNKLPNDMTDYLLKEDDAFAIARTLSSRGYTADTLKKILKYVSKMGDTTRNAI